MEEIEKKNQQDSSIDSIDSIDKIPCSSIFGTLNSLELGLSAKFKIQREIISFGLYKITNLLIPCTTKII